MQSGDIDTESKSGGVKDDLAAEPEIQEQEVKKSEVKFQRKCNQAILILKVNLVALKITCSRARDSRTRSEEVRS